MSSIEKQILKALDLCKQLYPERLPFEIWLKSSEVFGEACLELCVFCEIDGVMKVLLLRRPSDDPFFANLLHVPGCRKMHFDNNASMMDRALEEVNEYALELGEVRFAGCTTFKTKRGTEHADVRYIRAWAVPNLEALEHYYSVEDLPADVMQEHYEIIDMAYKAMKKESIESSNLWPSHRPV